MGTSGLVMMSVSRTVETKLKRLQELASQAAHEHGLSVLEVKFGQQGKRPTLEVCIFKKGNSIGLAECEKVSRDLEKLIDEEAGGEPLMSGAYVLEVVSPGIDRQLTTKTDFENFAGEQVLVKARENIGEVGSEIIGTLLHGDENKIALAHARPRVTGSKASNKKSLTKVCADELVIELSKLFKINLYSDDLKKVRKDGSDEAPHEI
jgi:ribosome maturation factor RimP